MYTIIKIGDETTMADGFCEIKLKLDNGIESSMSFATISGIELKLQTQEWFTAPNLRIARSPLTMDIMKECVDEIVLKKGNMDLVRMWQPYSVVQPILDFEIEYVGIFDATSTWTDLFVHVENGETYTFTVVTFDQLKKEWQENPEETYMCGGDPDLLIIRKMDAGIIAQAINHLMKRGIQKFGVLSVN